MVKLEQVEIGAWYQRQGGESFHVIDIDLADRCIEIMTFDGSLAELEFDDWEAPEMFSAAEPEDWSGSMDVDPENYGQDFDDVALLRDWDAVSALTNADALQF